MERALELNGLAEALGQHSALPTPEEFQRLIADLEVAIFLRRPQVPSATLLTAWYLHGVASSDVSQALYTAARQRRAFAVSAHVFDLALSDLELSRFDRLELGFASAVGYRRSELDPNATAVYRRLVEYIQSSPPVLEHIDTIALEAGLALLGLDTRRLFDLFGGWVRQLEALAAQVEVTALAGTSYGAAHAVVQGASDLLQYLAFGDPARLDAGRTRLGSALAGAAGTGDLNAKWVAGHLLAFADEFNTGSVWAVLPPDLPAPVKQAFTLTTPSVLTLWPPQRDLLTGNPSPLAPATRRVVVSVPTSAGKTLIGQLLMVLIWPPRARASAMWLQRAAFAEKYDERLANGCVCFKKRWE